MRSAKTNELHFLRAQINNTLGTNGAKPTKLIDSEELLNGFSFDPYDLYKGASRFRKAFYGTVAGKTTPTIIDGVTVEAADPDEELKWANPVIAVKSYRTPGFRMYRLTAGATLKEQFEATQANIPVNTAGVPTGRLYGDGYTTQSATLGSSTLVADAGDGSVRPFQTGDIICISRSTWSAIGGTPLWEIVHNIASGQGSFLTTVSASAVSYLGNTVTIQLAEPLNYDVPRRTFISAGIKTEGYIKNHADPVVVTRGNGNSSTGTYDDTTYPVTVHPQGGLAQQITLSFTSNFAFNCIGDTIGAMGGGNINTDFAPINPKHNMPYFTLKSSGWSGTWQAGDVVTFYIFTQCIPVWIYLSLPANAQVVDNVEFNLTVFNKNR